MGLLDVMLNDQNSGMSECFSTDLLNIRRKKRKILCFQHGRKRSFIMKTHSSASRKSESHHFCDDKWQYQCVSLLHSSSPVVSPMASHLSLEVAKRRRTSQFLSIKYYPSTSVILPGFNASFSSQTY